MILPEEVKIETEEVEIEEHEDEEYKDTNNTDVDSSEEIYNTTDSNFHTSPQPLNVIPTMPILSQNIQVSLKLYKDF